jgi:hypothetical protein
MQERLGLVETAQPYVGKYYSQDYVRRKILRQTDEEIIEQDKLIEKEIKDGVIPDPATIDPTTGMPFQDPNAMGGGDLGAPMMEPDLESQGEVTKASEMPKGGEI